METEVMASFRKLMCSALGESNTATLAGVHH